MISEPYINTGTGEIEWFKISFQILYDAICPPWIPYADFEREKLEELGADDIQTCYTSAAYEIITNWGTPKKKTCHNSSVEISYDVHDFRSDAESNRLLARARFLKAVCEKEGISWLPKKEMKLTKKELYGDHPCQQCPGIGLHVCREDIQRCDCKDSPWEELNNSKMRISLWQCGRCKKASSAFYDPETGKLPEKKDCYTCKQIDERLDFRTDVDSTMVKYRQKEEKEWRKALLDFLDIPNCRISRGTFIDVDDFETEFEDLRKRFL